MPRDIGVVDLLIGLPSADRRAWFEPMRTTLRDRDSRTTYQHAASYMFKDIPQVTRTETSVDELLREMDRHGIELGLVPVTFDDELAAQAVRTHADRLLGSYQVDPNAGVDAIRSLRRARDELNIAAATFFPAGTAPFVEIDDARAFPVYAACVELDLPIFVNGGVPGPRVPARTQDPTRVDVVCYQFPDLRFVFRHGCEPWEDLTVKLLLKWPNLYYSTSAFAPRYYPKAIIDFANTRGSEKVMYAGYYPYGLTLDRIFTELADVPFRDHVWPKFLRENALRVLNVV